MKDTIFRAGGGRMLCKLKFFSTNLTVTSLVLAVAGCGAKLPETWTRVDKRPVETTQLSVDKTICNGEMHKANLSAGDAGSDGTSDAMVSVYKGCMAQRGYVSAN